MPDNEKIMVQIHNVAGDLIYQYDGYSGSVREIDMSSRSKGLYFMEIRTDKGTAKKKIIIQ
jgi:hypothetical protein